MKSYSQKQKQLNFHRNNIREKNIFKQKNPSELVQYEHGFGKKLDIVNLNKLPSIPSFSCVGVHSITKLRILIINLWFL